MNLSSSYFTRLEIDFTTSFLPGEEVKVINFAVFSKLVPRVKNTLRTVIVEGENFRNVDF